MINPDVGFLGTLGLIATSNGTDRWIISCYHVLGRFNGDAFMDSESVMQGDMNDPVAHVRTTRANPLLDCIAAEVPPAVGSVREILGIQKVTSEAQPVAGMTVIKSGRDTGVTEGVIERVSGDEVIIGVPPSFPSDYELSGVGDSGSVWVEQGTGAAVALHRAGSVADRKAFGTSFPRVLTTLRLRML